MGPNRSPLAKASRLQTGEEVSAEMWHCLSVNNGACRKEEERRPFGGPISSFFHSAKVCGAPGVAKHWEGESNGESRSLSLSMLQKEQVFEIWWYFTSLLGDNKHLECGFPAHTGLVNQTNQGKSFEYVCIYRVFPQNVYTL